MKKSYISIGCPKHGWLDGPYRETTMDFGRTIIEHILCGYCPECGCYYTTAMASAVGTPNMIDGKKVLRGKISSNPNAGITYDTSPTLQRTAPEKRNVNIEKVQEKKVASANRKQPSVSQLKSKDQRQLQPQAKRRSVAPTLFTVTDYLLANHWAVGDKCCPSCRSRLSTARYNIPVYNEVGQFVLYCIGELQNCSRCHKRFMTDSEIRRLLSKLNPTPTSETRIIQPVNVKVRRNMRSDTYLFEPIADYGIYAYRCVSSPKDTDGGVIELNQSSFLRDMGYSTKVPLDKRRLVLDDAVRIYGKRRVADHLRFLILTRQGQVGGANKYYEAIQTWSDDMNYIADL